LFETWYHTNPGSVLSNPELDRIECALNRLAAEPLACVDGDDLARLHRLESRVQAEFARRLERFDREGGCSVEGCLTTTAWLRGRCHLTPGAAKLRVMVARGLRELEGTAAAFAAGDITYSHAIGVVRTASRVGAELVADAEPILLEAGRQLDCKRFGYVLAYFRNTVDPDGSLADANQQHDRNFLQLSQSWDGRWFLEGRLDAESGAVVNTALQAVTPPPAADDMRGASWRRAAGLVELCHQALASGRLRTTGGQKPHLVVTASLAALQRAPGTGGADLEGCAPIHTEAARRLACDCALSMVIVDADGTPLSVGRETGSIAPATRQALVLRDKGCRFPGCDRPARWTDAHHLVHRVDGGSNKLHNLVLLCRRHHRLVHEGGWTVSWGPGRELVASPPSLSRPP
jgi:hypothetical protein